ncbi:MAG: hypothetical protein QW303_03270 [Nitrososphaerota archaeon]
MKNILLLPLEKTRIGNIDRKLFDAYLRRTYFSIPIDNLSVIWNIHDDPEFIRDNFHPISLTALSSILEFYQNSSIEKLVQGSILYDNYYEEFLREISFKTKDNILDLMVDIIYSLTKNEPSQSLLQDLFLIYLAFGLGFLKFTAQVMGNKDQN